jgi:hypothetical protein
MSAGSRDHTHDDNALDDEFLRELEVEAAALSEQPVDQAGDQPGLTSADAVLVPLTAALSAEPPPGDLRARLLAELPQTRRFERFTAAVADLLDIDHAAAGRLLDQLDDRARYVEALPGVELFWVDGGPRVENALRGFVRIAAGHAFPEHEHFGEERVLVLQGSFTDPTRNRVCRPGDIDIMPAHSTHLNLVAPDGVDLLVLSVVQVGLTVAGQTFLPGELPMNQR